MKIPDYPRKPYALYKPQPPAKEVEQQTKLGTLSSQEDCTHSLESIRQHIVETYPTVDPNSVRFTMEINTTHGYYDEVSTSLEMHFFMVALVDNPKYTQMYAYYEEQIKKYDKDYQKYRDDLKQYKIDEKNYKTEVEKYQLWHAKETLKRLEPKIKKVKKQ